LCFSALKAPSAYQKKKAPSWQVRCRGEGCGRYRERMALLVAPPPPAAGVWWRRARAAPRRFVLAASSRAGGKAPPTFERLREQLLQLHAEADLTQSKGIHIPVLRLCCCD
jgi:uncharacterized membrane protein YccC